MSQVGVGEVDGKIYVVGGSARRTAEPVIPIPVTDLNMMYDPPTNAWHERAPLPLPLTHVGVTTLGGKLYAIGGFRRNVHLDPVDLAFVYDPMVDRWSELPHLSEPRGSVAAVAVGGRIHAFGGRRSDKVIRISLPEVPGAPEIFEGLGTVSTHEIYDPATGNWIRGKHMPGPARDHLGIAEFRGRVHLLGGRLNDFDIVDRHDVFDPRTEQWAPAAPLPGPRSDGAFAINGAIIYAGGECKPGGQPGTPKCFEDVNAYDPPSDSWETLTLLPHARHGFGAATVGGVTYFVAGSCCCGGGVSADLFALALDSRRNHVS